MRDFEVECVEFLLFYPFIFFIYFPHNYLPGHGTYTFWGVYAMSRSYVSAATGRLSRWSKYQPA